RHLILGAVGIFVYVGAEVAIGSFLVGFLTLENIAGFTEQQAAHYISYYFAGAMIGRFIGAVVMQKLNAGKVLACHGLLAVVLVLVAMTGQGILAMWAILLVGLCNSIMFPTIFSLALQGLGKYTSQGSGILCLAIVGGAIIPLLQGVLADNIGVQLALLLPIGCYLYITYFALFGSKVSSSTRHQ
ncbi:glucose/galactose MFS transporter, partial [Pseudoalteromonas sp.]